MTAAEKLRAAKALIDTPEKWTQGGSARDADGRLTYSDSDVAVSYCSWGALMDVDTSCSEACDFLDEALEGRHRGLSFITFNDRPDTTHADIMALFDRAISLAESDQ